MAGLAEMFCYGQSMRKWFARVALFLVMACVCLAAPSTEPKPDTERYKKTLSDATYEPSKVSLQEILRALKGTLGGKSLSSLSEAFPAFQVACGKADERLLAELVELFRLIPADDIHKGEFFVPLGQAWLRLRVPEALDKRPKFPEVAVGLKIPKDFPAAEGSALRRYFAVMAPMQQFFTGLQRQEGRSFQAYEAEYWQLVESLLASGNGLFSERLAEYQWGGGCGTGSEIFIIPHWTALAMAFVADGKWREAAGAALSVQGIGVAGSVRLLRACVEDPQAVVLGGLARLDLDSGSFFFGQVPLLAMALDLPGNSRANGLMALAVRAPSDNQANYFRALALLARERPGDEPSGAAYSLFSGADLSQARVQPVDKETRDKVKEFLCSQNAADLSIAGAEELGRILADNEWPKAVSALRRLLDHPSLTVAESAAKRLKEGGVTVEIPPKLGPVRCRLLVDGKPYASRRVQWYLGWDDWGRNDDVTSDADGVVEIPRDYFIDKTVGPIRGFGLHSLDMEDISAPWFGVQLPLPAANDDVIPVEVKTTAMRIVLPEVRPEAELAGKFIKVRVNPVTWPENNGMGFYQSATVGLPVAREFVLALAPGEYGIEVKMPGASNWVGSIHAGKVTEVKLPLMRASEVRYSFKAPEGWPEYAAGPELMRDGKSVSADHDTDRRVFRGVGVGKYVLHFPSSEELRGQNEFWRNYKAPDFKGADVPFEITDDSPIEIDLGKAVWK